MSILKLKDSQGNWVGVPTVKGDTGNGISSAVLNGDYTLTLTFTDGTTYTTPSIRGEKGEQGDPATSMDIHICSSSEYDSETRVPTITNPNDKTFYLVPTADGTSPDLFTEWVYVNNAWEMFGSASVDLSGYLTDVQVNGTSVVTDGVANVPIASSSTLGAVKSYIGEGVEITSGGSLRVGQATDTQVKQGTQGYRPITPAKQHQATFYGLAKASGDTTQSASSNAVGAYTDEAKDKIQTMLGVSSLIAPHESDPFESNHVIGELFIIDGKLYRAKTALTAGEYINEGTNVEVVDVAEVLDGKVGDVQINGTSVVINGIANIPVGTTSKEGVFKVALDSNIKLGSGSSVVVPTGVQHKSVFYGLAKASGDTTQSQSDNAVGTYTNEAKASIQAMLGVPSSDDVVSDVKINTSSVVSNGVATIPIGNSETYGVFKTDSANGIFSDNGTLAINNASESDIKGGTEELKPLTPNREHMAVFYGLAKASGDMTQAQSSNTVGTYTDGAKAAIKTMLGVHDTIDSFVEDVTGTDVTITGQPSYRYNCGELYSLTVTPPSSGTIDFRFTSGSTPTVLTLPQTVKMPEWWIEVEANTIYEMCITDGVYCGVMSWAM